MQHILKEMILQRQNRCHTGIYSACSASPLVLEAILEKAAGTGAYALIESTANQVNQFGGYTGMRPVDFAAFVLNIADKIGFPHKNLILGGDHLGPLTWQNEDEHAAMEKSRELIQQYVLAGFTKIHVDTSMRVAGDNRDERLSDEIIARRAADLVWTARDAYDCLLKKDRNAEPPVFVIGSEVPIPGGAQEGEAAVSVTSAEDFISTVSAFRDAFADAGIAELWDDVVGVVVQPGVEFGDASVHAYDRKKAENLTTALKDFPGIVFEGHSTDYQTKDALRNMVEDGIAILKVGPALTFYQREGLFALEMMERELGGLYGFELSNFSAVLDKVMTDSPSNWSRHYQGSPDVLAFKRKYSYSDRSRYYMPLPEVNAAAGRLISNLEKAEIPLSLISQYMPSQYLKIRSGEIAAKPVELIKSRIGDCIDNYVFAVS